MTDEPSPTNDQDGERPEGTEPRGRSGWIFWVVIGTILVVEFWLFGRRGDIEVCVGKQGVHDFALVGKERTDDNRWAFPRCERRLNLGLRSEFEPQVADAVKVACRGATTFQHQAERSQCVEGNGGWQHRVHASFIPPWDPRYRKQLFWFLY